MAENYRKFFDVDSEISLYDEDDDDVIDDAIPGGIMTMDARADDGDIGPQNDQTDDDVIVPEDGDNNNKAPVHVVRITDDRILPLTGFSALRQNMRRVLEHIAFRATTVLLVLLDVIVVIVDLAHDDRIRPMEVLSLIIMCYFMVECSLRLVAQGPKTFASHWIEVVDAVIILISFVFTILPLALSHLGASVGFIRLIVAGRLIRIILIIRLVSEKRNLERATRQMVSQNKRRYQRDGFDLDLCYITERVIAMSFPSTGIMALYRNPIKEVARFLNTKHPDHYMVFNLCSERMYDETLFHHRVTRYRVDDHNVPKLHDLLDFGKTARGWLDRDPDNVIAVHCKGGKGRTGTFICTWLVESGTFEEAQESLEFFGDRRTDLSVGDKYQGVETPSQGRYVGYYEKVKRDHSGNPPPEQRLNITSINIKSISAIGCGDGRDMSFKVITDNRIWLFDLYKQENCQVTHDLEDESIVITLIDIPVVTGDVKVVFSCSDKLMPRGYDDCLLYFWFHSSFIEDGKLSLHRGDLDNPHKSKTWNLFSKEFNITVNFQNASTCPL